MNRRKLMGSLIGLPGVLSLGGLLKMFPAERTDYSDNPINPDYYSPLDGIDWQHIDREMLAFMHSAYDKAFEPSSHLFRAIKEYLKYDIELVDRGRVFSAPEVGIHSYYEYTESDTGATMISFYKGAVPHHIERIPLKVRWTPEFAQDIRAYQHIPAERELGRILVEYVGMELKHRKGELLKDGKLLCWGIGLTPMTMTSNFIPTKGMYIDIEK